MSDNVARTKTRDEVLEDEVRTSPVDDYLEKRRKKIGCWLFVLIVVAVIAYFLWCFFIADNPVEYTEIEEHFKYGSIGSEPGGSPLDAIGGLLPPEPIFAALPRICPDLLPGGYESLGLIFEKDDEGNPRPLPVGVSQRYRLGLEQVGLNCAVCHVGTVRESPDAEPEVVLGMPAHQLELQDFFRFILDCVLDPRFTADKVIGEIENAGFDLSPADRMVYRFAGVARTREQTLNMQRRLQLLMGNEVTGWGRGRVDTFNPYKGLQFNWQLERLPLSELTGASDFPSLWNQAPREGMELHWDGNNDSLAERNLSASLGAGVTPVTVDHPRLNRVRDWALTLEPPEWPWSVDEAEATRGKQLYERYCFECHYDGRFRDFANEENATWGPEHKAAAPKVGTVEPIDSVGTDPYRLNSYTWVFSVNQYTLYPSSEYQFAHFHKTGGYANQPLDGIWARAPYLHNGSVPTLRALLDVPEERPATFYRGYDVYDQENVGFVHDVASEGADDYTLYDTSEPGNHNSGHLWGTDLTPDEKDAIVEYMKRF